MHAHTHSHTPGVAFCHIVLRQDDYDNELDASMDMGEDDAAYDTNNHNHAAAAMGSSANARTPAVGLVRDAYSVAQQSAQVCHV